MSREAGIAFSFARYSRLNGGQLAVATEDYVHVASAGIAIGGIGTVNGFTARLPLGWTTLEPCKTG